ncbi:MAG: hypothetical protein JXI33_06860 [Candidatus Aminicenantes bacterium]|nr:hypothetical protein [Candidatus Aminicenantes bacterium]
MPTVLFILESAAVGAFIAGDLLIFVSWAAAALALSGFIRGCRRLLTEQTAENPRKIESRVVLALSPLCLLFLKHMSLLWFLKDIRCYLLPTALAGSTGLLFFLFWDGQISRNAEGPIPRRTGLALCLGSFTIFTFLASGLVFPQHPLTGDEPHYLLITQSLLGDGDINLADEYANRDYLRFYPGELESHANPGRLGPDHQYSRHLPGLSVLLVPFYALGEKAGGLKAFVFLVRLPIMILTALLGMAFFFFIFDLTRNRTAALISWLAFMFTGPMLFFSGLIYPEVPVALITLLIFRHLIFKRDDRPHILFFSGLGLALLPWFGIKYIVLSAVFFVLGARPYLKKPAADLGKVVRLTLFPLVSMGLFLLFLWSCYGHVNPASAYTGVNLPSSLDLIRPLRPTDVPSFIGAALSLFFEKKNGIFIHAPLYLLVVAGFLILRKRKMTARVELVIAFGAYWFTAAAAFHLGGYCPPGRPLLPLMWIPGAFCACALAAPTGRLAAVIKAGLAGLSALIAGFSLSVPQLLYHVNSNPKAGNILSESRFLAAAGNLFFDPNTWTPALKASGALEMGPLAGWVLALLLVTVVILRLRNKTSVPSFSSISRVGIVLASSVLFLAIVFFHVRLVNPVSFKAGGYILYFQDENQFGLEEGGFWTKGTAEASVVLQSPKRLAEIALSLAGAAPGHAEIRVDRFRASVRHDPERSPEYRVVFKSPRGFRWRGAYLYLVRVREHSPFVPYHLDRRVPDNRTLGVFVRIAVK